MLEKRKEFIVNFRAYNFTEKIFSRNLRRSNTIEHKV